MPEPSEQVLQALEELHQQIDRMQPAIRQVEIAEQLISEVRKIPEQYIELLGKLGNQEQKFKEQLTNALESQASELKRQVKTVVDSAGRMIDGAKDINKNLSALTGDIKAYYNKMSGMQLDVRLDTLQNTLTTRFEKLDTHTSSLLLGIQNIQGELDLLESNIGSRLQDEAEKQKIILHQIQSQIKTSERRQKVFFIVTSLLIAISTTLILIIRK